MTKPLIMRRLFFLIILFFSLTSAWSIPAKRITDTYTLQDGSQRELTLVGDEFGHYFLSSEGEAFRMNEEGIMQPISITAANNRRLTRSVQRERVRKNRRNTTFQGEKRGLVILVNFSDKQFTTNNPQEVFSRIFNEEGYNEGYFTGSVHDYFYDQSYGVFNLQFDVVGPYTVSKKMSYYGENNKDDEDKYAATMVQEACLLANEDVDFTQYDWAGDGEVDQVYVIYAGYSEASGADASTVWPHEWDFESAAAQGDGTGALFLDGVYVNTYACSSELMGRRGTRIDGIGTACHEFSHCLGLPDMYDTDASGGTYNFGMDCWDLLDYGCYNNNGYTPASFTSYERMFCGWLTPVVITDAASIREMSPITSAPEAYIIYNKADSDEYYLLENHQNQSWDTYAYGHGLLVLHVDYDEDAWYNNTVNNISSRQRMTIIPADNKLSSTNLSGDPFPGTSGNTSLTNTTTPAAKLYSRNSDGTKFLSCPITDIQESSSGLISFETDGDQTAIYDVEAEQTAQEFFDLLGRHLPSRPSSGFYIHNGKKHLLR